MNKRAIVFLILSCDHGGTPVNIISTVPDRLQISAPRPCLACLIISGAIKYGVPSSSTVPPSPPLAPFPLASCSSFPPARTLLPPTSFRASAKVCKLYVASIVHENISWFDVEVNNTACAGARGPRAPALCNEIQCPLSACQTF